MADPHARLIEDAIGQRKADQQTFRRIAEAPTMFTVGDHVIKTSPGTSFCGIVKSVYPVASVIEAAAWRMDVMSIVPAMDGLVHIYRPDQFRLMTDTEIAKLDRMRAIWEGENG